MTKSIFAVLPLSLLAVVACGGATASPTADSLDPQVDDSANPDRKSDDGGSPDADAGTCFGFGAGGSTCSDDLAMFKQAADNCESAGEYLTSFALTPGDHCAKGTSSGYSGTCCTTPPSCTDGFGSAGGKCQRDDVLFESAVAACAGGSLIEFETKRGSCAKGFAESSSGVCTCM